MTIHGSTREHPRAVREIAKGDVARRRTCPIGRCQNKCTHQGVVMTPSGPMAMTSGRCQFHAYAWVRDGRDAR